MKKLLATEEGKLLGITEGLILIKTVLLLMLLEISWKLTDFRTLRFFTQSLPVLTYPEAHVEHLLGSEQLPHFSGQDIPEFGKHAKFSR